MRNVGISIFLDFPLCFFLFVFISVCLSLFQLQLDCYQKYRMTKYLSGLFPSFCDRRHLYVRRLWTSRIEFDRSTISMQPIKQNDCYGQLYSLFGWHFIFSLHTTHIYVDVSYQIDCRNPFTLVCVDRKFTKAVTPPPPPKKKKKKKNVCKFSEEIITSNVDLKSIMTATTVHHLIQFKHIVVPNND